MSGLLERIVRRARASASSQLGLGTRNGATTTNGRPYANGAVPPAQNGTRNGVAISDGPTAVIPAVSPQPPTEVHPPPESEPEREPEPASEPEPAPEPEPEPQAEQAPAARVGFLGRGRVRRRVHYLRRLRELQFRDLGGFLVELRRHGRERPDLVQEKVDGALRTDTELRALVRALGSEPAPSELRTPGIGGACRQCGAIHGSADRFCASCGAPLSR
ncbi:MAG TPA: hypothetical protein VGI87_06570 [Solirubrobacteraceae bacterium]|jgi:hypothetical protein